MDMPSLIRILVPAFSATEGRRKIHIVFRNGRDTLVEPVRRALDGVDDVVVVADRRKLGDRRRHFRLIPFEWRRAERRRPAVSVADIVIEDGGGEPPRRG